MTKKKFRQANELSRQPREEADFVTAILDVDESQQLVRSSREWSQNYADDALEFLRASLTRQTKIDIRRLRSAGRAGCSRQEWSASVNMDEDDENRIERLLEVFMRLGLQGRRAYGLPLPDPDEWEKRLEAGLPLSDLPGLDEKKESEDCESTAEENLNGPPHKSVLDEPDDDSA
jgi:hypothetical protein